MRERPAPGSVGVRTEVVLTEHLVSGLHVVSASPVAALPVAALSMATESARPPLLLIHGATHGAWCWERWLPALAVRGWPAYALSLRNHPGSYAVDEATYLTGLTLANYLEDVAEVAEWIEMRTGRPLVAVGHSLGGILAQLLAERQTRLGNALRALVLLASVPPYPLGPLRDRPVPLTKAYLPAVARVGAKPPDDPIQASIVRRMVPESPSVMNEYSLGPGVPVERALLMCPMLVVSAQFDNTIVPHDHRIAHHYGCDYLLAERIGHAMMLEDGWEPLLDNILAWLAGKL
jgi:pimeloyl-ACP methyl ester carboxylesterase